MTQQISLSRQLYKMTWPMMFGVLSLMSFQLVDSAFIGQLGVLPLAAQGFTLPIQMVIIGIQVGLGIATTAIIARALGANENQYAKQLGGLIILFGSVGVAIICGAIWLIREPILVMLSAPEAVYSVIDSYWIVWLASAWVGAVLYFCYSLCRANGNTMLPGTMMMITSAINLILDPIFIFWFDLGINGAAIATILAFGFGVAMVMPKIIQKHWISFDWATLNIFRSLSEIGKIMGPAMMSQLLPPISSMLATKLIAGFGTTAVAAWALGSRFEFFAIVVVLALTMSMPPMIGRLLGAGKIREIQKLVTIATTFILIWQLSIAIIVFILTPWLSDLMSSEESVRTVLDMHLLLVPFSLGPLGVCMLMVSVTNALALSMRALLISSLRLFAFFIPCLWIGAQLGELPGLFWGVAIGNTLAGAAAWMLYKNGLSQIALKYQVD